MESNNNRQVGPRFYPGWLPPRVYNDAPILPFFMVHMHGTSMWQPPSTRCGLPIAEGSCGTDPRPLSRNRILLNLLPSPQKEWRMNTYIGSSMPQPFHNQDSTWSCLQQSFPPLKKACDLRLLIWRMLTSISIYTWHTQHSWGSGWDLDPFNAGSYHLDLPLPHKYSQKFSQLWQLISDIRGSSFSPNWTTG